MSTRHKIFIGGHRGLTRDLYLKDGIHLNNKPGRQMYTESVLSILKSTQLTSPEFNYHQSCPQYQYQHRQDRHSRTQYQYRQEHSYPSDRKVVNFEQRSRQNQFRQNQFRQNQFQHRLEYRQPGDRKFVRQNDRKQYEFTLPTANRFDRLSGLNQGNY